MNSFKDKNEKKWLMNLNLGSAMRVKAMCEVDLLNLITLSSDKGAQTDGLEQLISDPYKFINVVYVLCVGHDGNDNMELESFAEVFDATTVELAIDCLIREIIDFSQPAKKKILNLLYTKTRDYQEMMEKKVSEIVDSKEFNKELDSQLSELLTNLPE